MNISSISFNGKIHNYTYKRNQNKNEKQPHSGKIIPKTLATVLASSALAILLSNTPGQALNRPQKVTIPFDNNKTSVSEISKKYNVNEDAINAFNEINENNNISELSELKVPSDFDYIQTKIEEKQTQLYSQDLNEEERFNVH